MKRFDSNERSRRRHSTFQHPHHLCPVIDVWVDLRFFPEPRKIGETIARWEELASPASTGATASTPASAPAGRATRRARGTVGDAGRQARDACLVVAAEKAP